MSRNFFSDILNVEGVLYQAFVTFFNGSWNRLNRPKSGANAIVPPPPMRPGQRRPDMPPGLMPPQRPGAAPQRPGGPPQAAQAPPVRPGSSQPTPPQPGNLNVPQIPGLNAPDSKAPTRAEEEFNLIKARGKGAFANEINRQLSQLYMRARSLFEMRS